MRTEVYSWRLSPDLKMNLERHARVRNRPMSKILESAVRDWLKRHGSHDRDGAEQLRLHAAAARAIGSIQGGNPRRSQNARRAVRTRLKRHRAR